MKRRPLLSLGMLAICLGLLCMAPTPGDVGGCGQEAEALSARKFFATKKRVDCLRCRECSIGTRACQDACDAKLLPDTAFPETCLPLVHDGEVCLRALEQASCGAYEDFMSDSAPTAPTECNFCPPEQAP